MSDSSRHTEMLETLDGSRARDKQNAALRVKNLKALLQLPRKLMDKTKKREALFSAETVPTISADAVNGYVPENSDYVIGTPTQSEFNALVDDVRQIAGVLDNVRDEYNELLDDVKSLRDSVNTAHSRLMTVAGAVEDSPTTEQINRLLTDLEKVVARLREVGSEVQTKVLP